MSIKSAKDLVAEANKVVETIDVAEARRLHDAGTVQFVDIREPAEWGAGHVPGAVHIPRGLLEFRADPTIPTHNAELHADKKLVLYCASGGRSALAAKTLADMGFENVAHVAGGYTAWHESGNPVER